MNKQTLVASIGTPALAAMLGCSTSQPVSPAATDLIEPPPPEVSIDLPLEPPDTGAGPQFCKLGTSCLAMDPRPFEPCLLATKECRDKATEPLLVGEPEPGDPPAIIKTR